MTTDITELAQSLKSAAEKATQGEWRRASTQFNGITATPFMLGRKEVIIAGASEKRDAEFIALANPANIIALVEALEKAQNENELARGQLLIAHRTLLNQQQSIADLVTGRQNLQQTMGVYVHAYEEAKEQIAKDVEIKARLCRESNSLFDRLREAEKRIAELESRTVTVKLPQAVSAGGQGYQAQVERILTAAGIKAEADSLDADVNDRNQPGMVVAVHIDVGDFVKFRGQVYEVKETDFDDHDVTLWFVCGEVLKCAAGCPIEVVSAPGKDE